MSNKAITYVFENSKTVGSARVLMLAIADMANNDGECWPGKAKLHKLVNVSLRMITRLIQECERLGELAVIQGQDNQTNRYLVVGVAAEQKIEKARPAREKKARAKRVTSVPGVTSDADDMGTSVPGDITPSVPGVTQTLSKPSINPQSMPDAIAPAQNGTKAPAKPRKRNAMFDAIVEAFQYDADGLTKNEASLIGTVAAQLTAAQVTPDEVPALYAWCKRQNWKSWGPGALTTNVSNWRKTAKPRPVTHPASDWETFA